MSDPTHPLLSSPTEMLKKVLAILVVWRDVDLTKLQYFPPYDTDAEKIRGNTFIQEQVKLIPLIEEELKRREPENLV